jgi:hypothetical protein
MVPISKLLAFSFWELRRLFVAIYDDGWADFKAMAFLICAQAALVVTFFDIASLVLGHKVSPRPGLAQNCFMVAMSAVIVAANYFSVQYNAKWRRFEAEFEGYSPFVRVCGCVVVAIIVLASFISMIFLGAAVSHLPRYQ